jgi:integrator complex subunit 7
VHHNIRNALDSHDTVELHAAIFAAGKFAAQSKTFAVNMCSKISEMIKGYATPLEMKLRLIPIFQHMHHDAQTAQVTIGCWVGIHHYLSGEFIC